MEAIFKKNGERIKITLSADALAGTPILVNHHVFVTCNDGVSGETVEAYATGVFELTAGGAIAQGKNIKMDNATKKWTVAAPDAGGATPGDPVHGIAWSDAAADASRFLGKLV